MGTDHCPFTRAQKLRFSDDFSKIPGGLPGVETLLPLAYHLAMTGQVSLPKLSALLSTNAARLFGMHKKGRIKEGFDADIVLLNPESSTTISSKTMHSRTDYSPFEGLRLHGAIEKVFLRGQLGAEKRPSGVEPALKGQGRFVSGELPIEIMEAPV